MNNLQTDKANALLIPIRDTLMQTVFLLDRLDFYEYQSTIDRLKVSLDQHISAEEEDELLLNDHFILNAVLSFWTSYGETWKEIISEQFNSSWSSLQDCLDRIREIKKFSNLDLHQFEGQLIELEKGYPFKVFCSVGLLVEGYDCSICGKDIESFDCEHVRGELYKGQVACAIAKNEIQLDHVAFVENPANKRCVAANLEDSDDQFFILRTISESISSRKVTILGFSSLRFSKRLIPNPEHIRPSVQIGRNDPCYCGSLQKHKKCCLSKELIESDHVDIVHAMVMQ